MLTVKSDQGPNCHTSEHYSAQVCNAAVWDYGSTLKHANRLLTDMAERHRREYQCIPPVSFFPFTLKVTLAEGWTGLPSRNIKCKTLFFKLEERQTDYTNTHTHAHTYFASTHMQQCVLPIPLSSLHTLAPTEQRQQQPPSWLACEDCNFPPHFPCCLLALSMVVGR